MDALITRRGALQAPSAADTPQAAEAVHRRVRMGVVKRGQPARSFDKRQLP
jgi:hypothetical protein